MIGLLKKRQEKLGITHFGLMRHEVAVLQSAMDADSELAAEYELREPNEAGTCDIVVVNQDSQLATSWWKFYKKRNPEATPLFLTDSKETLDDGVFCKRPFSPSVLLSAVQGLVGKDDG